MKKAKYTKNINITLEPEMYERVKKVTDCKELGLCEFYRIITESVLPVWENQMNLDQFILERLESEKEIVFEPDFKINETDREEDN